MNAGRNAFAAAIDAMPASRSSLTRRSCSVPKARSTRPLAWLELAQMMSMFSACSARPNWVMPSPPSAPGWLTRKTPCFVAVERHRLAPGLQISAGGVEIGEGRLTLDKLKLHQPAGRVVDEHQQ